MVGHGDLLAAAESVATSCALHGKLRSPGGSEITKAREGTSE